MSNKPETFCDYFKIKWGRRSGWTLEQAAYLSCGENPELKNFEISVFATNHVSKRFYWLLNKEHTFKVVDVIDGIKYFNTGSLYRPLNENFDFDEDMDRAYNHMYSRDHGVDETNFVTRAVFREAGRLVFEMFPHALINDVAAAIEKLPKFYNDEHLGQIGSRRVDQIATYLKGFSKFTQKPKAEDVEKVDVDLQQLVEMMSFFPDSKNPIL